MRGLGERSARGLLISGLPGDLMPSEVRHGSFKVHPEPDRRNASETKSLKERGRSKNDIPGTWQKITRGSKGPCLKTKPNQAPGGRAWSRFHRAYEPYHFLLSGRRAKKNRFPFKLPLGRRATPIPLQGETYASVGGVKYSSKHRGGRCGAHLNTVQANWRGKSVLD